MKRTYALITWGMVKHLEEGVIPWQRPWPDFPAHNMATGQRYGGVNAIVLNNSRYQSPWWLSFREAAQLGGRVKPGEPGTPVVYWKSRTGKDGETKSYIRYANVFNFEQCEGIQARIIQAVAKPEPLARARSIVEGAKLSTVFHRGQEPRYLAGLDQIWMPWPDKFTSSENYYHTLFGQMARATGHPRRLNREGLTRGGRSAALKEELIADIAACFLSNEAGILPKVDFRNAPIRTADWYAAYSKDPKFFVSAATQAQEAADLTLHRINLTVRANPEQQTRRAVNNRPTFEI